jgi:hypothetical protein
MSQAFSENVDQIKCWLGDDVTSPIMEKLENVETSAYAITNHSIQSSEDIKSLSDAVSTMSSEISQIKELLSIQKSSKHHTVYSYSATLGIEEAIEENKCSYCGADFLGADWTTCGKHLVVTHKFGGCNINTVYDSFNQKDEFRSHLMEYHHHNARILHARYHRRRSRLLTTHRRMSSILATDGFGNPGTIDKLSASSIEDGATVSEGGSVAKFLNDLKDIKDCFHDAEVDNEIRYLRDLSSRIMGRFWEIDWKLCCIIERFIINGVKDKFSKRVVGGTLLKRGTIATILALLPKSRELDKKVDIFISYTLTVHRGLTVDITSSNLENLNRSVPEQS